MASPIESGSDRGIVIKCILGWRLAGSLLNRYRRRARGLAAGGVLLLAFFLHIGGGLGRGVEIHRMFVVVPHDKVARRKQIFYGAPIAAVGDAQVFLYIRRTECKGETILVATQVKIQTQRCTR